MAKKWSEKFKTISKKAAKLSQANRKLLLKREHVLYSTFQGKQDQAFNSQELDQYGVGFGYVEKGGTQNNNRRTIGRQRRNTGQQRRGARGTQHHKGGTQEEHSTTKEERKGDIAQQRKNARGTRENKEGTQEENRTTKKEYKKNTGQQRRNARGT